MADPTKCPDCGRDNAQFGASDEEFAALRDKGFPEHLLWVMREDYLRAQLAQRDARIKELAAAGDGLKSWLDLVAPAVRTEMPATVDAIRGAIDTWSKARTA